MMDPTTCQVFCNGITLLMEISQFLWTLSLQNPKQTLPEGKLTKTKQPAHSACRKLRSEALLIKKDWKLY